MVKNIVRLPDKLLVTVSYLVVGAIALVIYFLVNLIWGDRIPLTFAQLQGHDPQVLAGLSKVWFIFVWGACITLLGSLLRRSSLSLDNRDTFFVRGWWLSLNAGVFEELIYRWLVFFIAMGVISALNVVTHGFMQWLYTQIFVPIADIETLHALSQQMFHWGSWVIGAGIVTAANRFSNDHKYLGTFGQFNAWVMGMVFFFLMFNYGIVTAIVAHVLYDAVIFTVMGLVYKERSASEVAAQQLAAAIVAAARRTGNTRSSRYRR